MMLRYGDTRHQNRGGWCENFIREFELTTSVVYHSYLAKLLA